MHLIQPRWKKGRGRTTVYSAEDVLLMVLVTLKNGGTCDFLARIFNINPSTSERLVTKFVRMFSEPLFDKSVLEPVVYYSMTSISRSNKLFKNHDCALYATDVTFWQSNRHSDSLGEGKRDYSDKHKLYDFKVEVTVLPIGLAVHCTDHYPGGAADFGIFWKNSGFHEVALAKSEKESTQTAVDNDPMKVDDFNVWILLADKGYQGSKNRVRTVHP